MALIEFKNLPDTSTPLNAENLNNNFNELNTKIAGIVESGSNDNGSWVKYSDGTLMCMGVLTSPKTGQADGNFPIPFIANPMCALSIYNVEPTAHTVKYTRTLTTITAKVYDKEDTLYTTNHVYVTYIAIGKWK